MEFFIDTANIDEIRRANELGVVDGVTTNPSLIAKEGRDFEQAVKEICDLIDGPVSAEVIGLEADEMIEEARELASWADNIVVKIPMTGEGLKAVNTLSKEGIRTNVTLIFSAAQALLAAKAGATYASPFVGRLDDRSHEGMELVKKVARIYDNYGFSTKIITSSIRGPLHVVEAALCGSHVATIPFDVIEKMQDHPLTDIGIERFLADWEEYKKEG